MPHPLVVQLRFARSEFRRGLEGLSEEDATKRVGPANSISWVVGHLAWQEQRYWIIRLQDKEAVVPRLNKEFCYGCPPSVPSLTDMWGVWNQVVAAADPALDRLTTEDLEPERTHREYTFTFGALMYRTIYHYWYHLGESLGLRQAIGHTGLPDFVGDLDTEAPFQRF
jgi:hypothetical protein